MHDQDGERCDVDDYFERHSYLGGAGVTQELVAAVMHALARATAAAPWRDRRIDGLVLEIAEPTRRQLFIHVREPKPRFPMLQVVSSARAFAALLGPFGENEAHPDSEPRRVVVDYCTAAKLGATERAEVERHGWAVFGAKVPYLHFWEGGMPCGAPSVAELSGLALVADALAHVRDAVTPSVWRSASAIDCSIMVEPLGRPTVVRIRGPLWHAFDGAQASAPGPYVPTATAVVGAPYDSARVAATADLPDLDEDFVAQPASEPSRMREPDRVRMAAFGQWLQANGSPTDRDAEPAVAVGWLAATLRADDGPLLTEIGAASLELFLLDRIPACANLVGDDALRLAEGLRIYFEWLASQGDPLAPGCVDLLNHETTTQLAKNLGDRRRFSHGKTRALSEIARSRFSPIDN